MRDMPAGRQVILELELFSATFLSLPPRVSSSLLTLPPRETSRGTGKLTKWWWCLPLGKTISASDRVSSDGEDYCWLLPELEKALLADRVQVPPAEQAPQMSFWSRLQNKQIRFQNKWSSPHGFHYEMALALPAPGDPSNWPLVTLVPHPWSLDKAWEWPCIVLTFCCCCYPLRGQCGKTVSLFGRMGLLRCLDSVYRSWQPPLVTIILWEAPGSQVRVTSCSCKRLTVITYFSAVPGGRRRQLVKAALPRNRKGKLRVSPFLAKWLDNSSRSTGCRVRKFHPVWLLAAWHWESHLTLFPQL